jgi:hypothetical protein
MCLSILLYILGPVIMVSSLRTLVVGNRSGYHDAKCLDLGEKAEEKAEKMVLPGKAAFLLTIITAILPIGGA